MKKECLLCKRSIGVAKKTGELSKHKPRKGSKDHKRCGVKERN